MAFFQRSQSMGRRSERRARTHPLERLGASTDRRWLFQLGIHQDINKGYCTFRITLW